MKQKPGRKLLIFLLTLVTVFGMLPWLSLTAKAAAPALSTRSVLLRPGEVAEVTVTLEDANPGDQFFWGFDGSTDFDNSSIELYTDKNCTDAVDIISTPYDPGTFYIKAIHEGISRIEARYNAGGGNYAIEMCTIRVLDFTPIPDNCSDAGSGLKYYVGFNPTTGTYVSGGNENYPNLCNGNDNKFCIKFPDSNPIYVEFHANKPFVPKRIYLRTASDNSTENGRNPKNWKFLAKLNDTDEWTTIADVQNDSTMQDKDLRAYSFDLSNPSNQEYQYFRFEVSAVVNGNTFQLSELYMAGNDKYTLQYAANGGSGQMAGTRVMEGETIKLPSCAFTAPENKVFSAWTVSGSESRYSEGDKLKIREENALQGIVTVTANWKDKTTSEVSKAPIAKELLYTGSAQALIIAGEATGGTMYYAVTIENKAPTDDNLYTTSIPTGINAGTYYVWYKVIGDKDHLDSIPAAVKVVIKAVAPTATPNPVPQTGDTANPALWLGLIVLGLIGAAGTVLVKARKR